MVINREQDLSALDAEPSALDAGPPALDGALKGILQIKRIGSAFLSTLPVLYIFHNS